MSIGKYLILLRSPNLACNADVAASVAAWSSVTFTTKLSVAPLTVAPARFLLEIPGLVISTVVPLLFDVEPVTVFPPFPPPLVVVAAVPAPPVL